MEISFKRYFETAPPTLIVEPGISGFKIITANDAYLKSTQANLEGLIGIDFFEVFSNSDSSIEYENIQNLKNSIADALRLKEQQALSGQRYTINVSGNDYTIKCYWQVTISPVLSDDQEVQCLIVVTQDVKASVSAALKERFIHEVAQERNKAVQQIQEQLRLAIDSAEMGTWFMNLHTWEFKPSARMKSLFSYDPALEMTYETALNQILPEYRQQVSKAVDDAIKDGISFHIEYPITGFEDRTIRWLRATGKRYEAKGSEVAHFSGTVIDITEQKLEAMRRNDFLNIASHELKTPLSSLKGSLQLLNKMKHNPRAAMLPKLIEQSNRSMDKISALVDDLLDVGRITEGTIELNRSVFNLTRMIEGCCTHVTIGSTHELYLEGDREVNVYADELRVDQVLVNLVNNAVKYALGSYKIILKIELVYPMAKISVQDFGPGIPHQHLDQLFNRYYRADKHNTQSSGLGLGLFISAEIIKKHGGEVGVTSKLGEGSTFWFTIPLAVTEDQVG